MTHKKSVGSILRETRLSKNISLKLIASDLKISLDILEDIENDIIPEYLNKVYITGHVRAYANYLNIDSDNLIKYFKNQILFNDKNILKEFPKPLSNSNFLFFSKGTSLVSFVFITVAFYFFFIRSSDLQPDYSITPDLTQEMISEIESIDLDSFITDEYDIDNENNLVENNYATNELKDITKNNQASIVVASLPKKTEIDNLKDNITLKFLESTWIQLRNINNEIIFSKLMNSNSEYTYSIDDNLFLTTGNAGNILIYIGSESKGKLGKKGEVIESINISSKFN